MRSTLVVIMLLQTAVSARTIPGDQLQATRFSASYIGDLLSNFSGGLRRGSAYLGVANLSVTFDFQDAGIWQGGKVHLHAAGTHGGTPSGSLIGDLQVVSNIEAGEHTSIQELWIGQLWGSLEIIAGIQDFNLHFAQNEHTGAYLNSSFGVPSTIAVNSQTSIFPLTSPGLTAIWSASSDVTLLAALFDGSPTEFDRNPYDLDWHVGPDDGAFIAAEVQYRPGADGHTGTAYRVGAYRHSHRAECGTDQPGIAVKYGVYATVDRTVWDGGDGKGIDVFARSGVCPCEKSLNPFFVGAGINLRGVLSDGGEDMLGFALAHAATRAAANETTFELTYVMPVADHLTVQPDMQYIINPAGASAPVTSSVVGVVRFIVDL